MLNVLRQFVSTLRKSTSTPSYVDIRMIVYDMNHERTAII